MAIFRGGPSACTAADARLVPLPAVHAALLDDLVFPTQIEARRTRYRTDGSKLLKVYLDPKGAFHVAARLVQPWRAARRLAPFARARVPRLSQIQRRPQHR